MRTTSKIIGEHLYANLSADDQRIFEMYVEYLSDGCDCSDTRLGWSCSMQQDYEQQVEEVSKRLGLDDWHQDRILLYLGSL